MVAQVCVLGSTGSIGVNTLDVIARHPDRYQAFALSANNNVSDMLAQCEAHKPTYAVMVDEQAAEQLQSVLKEKGLGTEVLAGAGALEEIASHEQVDMVMAAIVGAAGLAPNLAAIRKGKRVLLANKESLVMSGELFMREARASDAVLLPIDSEHNAIYQCLPEAYQCGQNLSREIRRILLTASGGPFRGQNRAVLHEVTPEQACNHPNWNMGQKISVDSATLMNKGLELIEACWLFNVAPEKIEVHIHPESIVHSMVEYCDGSVLAQMGTPDMRTPIAYGLAWPERIDAGVGSLDFFAQSSLHFERPDEDNFPCLKLARQAFHAGGTAGAVLNAANEEAVAAFLKGNIRFTAIPDIIANALDTLGSQHADTLDTIVATDQAARKVALDYIQQMHMHA
ncbi:MAG: 1-deoxy-D-xylulose-5-phosphate reductoisomerase [Oleiphilaceae bacterium]|nr:1-deoxy-D-xylulose-5-phosphate reductoisomerase [Oleiphilaceae bacterium]